MANELVKVVAGIPVRARASDKYVDATALCKAGGKEWTHFERNRETQEFLAALASKLRILSLDLIQKRRGYGGGTWVHPEVAIRLCMWISGEVAAQVTGWINTLLTTGRVELPAAAPSGFVAIEVSDPVEHQLALMQQTCVALIDARRRQVALERQQQELARQQEETRALVAEARADAADTRALAVCAANTARAALDHVENNHGYYAVRAFARIHRWEMPEAVAATHGRRLSAMCRERNIRIGQVKDERHGYVGSYPETLLAEYFAERLDDCEAA